LSDDFLSFVYKSVYEFQRSSILDYSNSAHPRILEIGSAGGITKSINPLIITSDIRWEDQVDLEIKNQKLPIEDSSLDGIIGKDVLHHIPDLAEHFSEVLRCLKVGGVAIYSEPNWNLFSKIIFVLLHPEPFITKSKEWKFSSHDPMYSNQALPFIVFERDIEEFRKMFKEFEVFLLGSNIGLSFLISGGVYSRTKVPSKVLISLMKLENRYPVWIKLFGLNRFILIRKRVS
jgi:SAM-dependent methyltransferase